MEPDSMTATYFVVENGEAQFSIWPSYRDVPPGWVVRGDAAPKDQCLEFIREHWVDMRPRSLRVALGEGNGAGRNQ